VAVLILIILVTFMKPVLNRL